MNGMETIEARFLSTFSQQIMGTIKPYDTHVVSCHHARNKRTIVRAWEIDVGFQNHPTHRSLSQSPGRPDPGVVASTSLSMDVAKRLSTPQRG